MSTSFVKRWIKYSLKFFSTVVMLGLILVFALLIVLDDDDYRKLAVWAVARATGYRIIFEGPFTVNLSTNPSLTAEQVRFQALPGGPPSHLKSIGQFHLQIDLESFLLGTLVIKRLEMEDVVIEDLIAGHETGDESRSMLSPPDIELPVFESVSLKNIRLTDDGGKIKFLLDRLGLDDVQDAGPVILTAVGSVNDKVFKIDGRLGALQDIFDRSKPYPLEIKFYLTDLILQVNGKIADYEDGRGLNLQVAANGVDLRNLLQLFHVDFPSPGQLNLGAAISGSLAAPRVSDLKIAISNDPSLEFSAGGAIANLANGNGVRLQLAGRCRNRDLLDMIFPDSWKVLEEFKFEGAIRDVADGYRIEDMTARTINDKRITLEAGGWLRLGEFGAELAVREVDLKFHLDSPHTAAIRPLLTDSIPEIGSVNAEARLIGPVEHLALEDLVIIRGGAGPVGVETRGRIGWIPLGKDDRLADMDLEIEIRAAESKILSDFYGVPIEEIGEVTITGRVTGATDRFQIRNIEFHSRDANGLEANMSGGIDFDTQANGKLLGDVKFDLEIKAPNMAAGEPLLGANLVPTLGPVSAKSLVVGTTATLAFENIDVLAGRPDKVQIKWQGRVGQFPLGDDRPVAEVQTFGALEAARSSDLAALFGLKLPDIGPVRATWREIDRRGIYGVDNIKFVAGDGKNFQLGATGRVASVIQHKQANFDGVELELSLKATDTHNIFKLVGMQFPNLGAVDGRLSLMGEQEKLVAKNIHVKVSSPEGLQIGATGGVGYIGLAKDLPVRDIDLGLTAQAPGIGALPHVGDWHLPDLGPLTATARVRGRDSAVNVESIDLRAGPKHKPLFQIQGTLENVGHKGKINLAVDFKADSRPWFDRYLGRKTADTPSFFGSINLAGAEEHVRIDKFQISTEELSGLSLTSSGILKSGPGSPEIELQLNSSIQDPAAWGASFGISLPQLSPLTVDGRYSGLKEQRTFEGLVRLGTTGFQTHVRQPVDDARLGLDVRLSSATVHLEDLGFTTGDQSEKPAGRKPSPLPISVFDDSPFELDSLQAYDFALNIWADKVTGESVGFGPVKLEAALKNGRLRITSADMSYQQGQLTFESIFDANAAKPQASVKIAAEDMSINDILIYLHQPVLLEGELNLTADLQSHGSSIKQMAANLSGEFGVAIENGRIQRGVEMIASDALDLLFTAPAKDTYTDLNCMAGRLDFEAGVGTIKIMYLDTPGVRARGFGSINLAAETVDIVIEPKSKRRLFKRSSPVRITGQLNNPAVKKIPANEAAILAGQLAVPIVALPARALGILFSLIKDDKDENSPCLTGELLKAE